MTTRKIQKRAARGTAANKSVAATTMAVAIADQPSTPSNLPGPIVSLAVRAQPKGSKTINVDFTLVHPVAERVALSGEFNGWSADAAPMTVGPDGRWKTSLTLQPGRYQYKFVVDGMWVPDPEASEQIYNQFGTLNSVIEVRS